MIDTLPNLPLAERASLPTCSAIYFVLDAKGVILYIGATANVFERWRQHDGLKRFGAQANVIAWQETPIGKLRQLEKSAIRKYKPTFNKRLISYPRGNAIRYRPVKDRPPLNLQLGDVLRKWRMMTDIDQRTAAQRMGISAPTLCRLEKGDFQPESQTLLRLLQWLLGPRQGQ